MGECGWVTTQTEEFEIDDLPALLDVLIDTQRRLEGAISLCYGLNSLALGHQEHFAGRLRSAFDILREVEKSLRVV